MNKKHVIALLVCLNVGLLGGLVAVTLPQADAQPVAAPAVSNYLLMTGQVHANEDAIYVLDVTSRRLAVWEFDHDTKRLERVRLMRDLAADFRRGG